MENREQTLEGRLLLWLSDWLTVLLLSAGAILPCLAAAGISGQSGFDLGAVLAFCVFGALGASALLTWRHGVWAALALAAGDGLILWRLWRHMTEDWLLGRPPWLMDLIDQSPGTLYLLYVLAVLLLAWAVVRARQWWLAAALVLLPILPAIGRGVLPSWGAMLAGLVGWGSMLLTGLFDRRDLGSLGRARFVSLVGMTALVGILVMALPMEGYLRPQWATDARDDLIQGVSRRLERFFTAEDLENNILTQLGLDLSVAGGGSNSGSGQGGGSTTEVHGSGAAQREDLLNAGPRRYAERMLMSVRSVQPDPAGRIYLRGRSFGVYTGTSWETGGDSEDWRADASRAGLLPALTAPDAPAYTLLIRDVAFQGSWYYPYRYTDENSGGMDPEGLLTLDRGEDAVPLEELTGIFTEEYRISYRPGGPEDGFVPLDGGWAAIENQYRYGGTAFSDLYLSVPAGLQEILEPLLEEIRRESAAADSRLPEQFQPSVTAAAQTAAWLASAAVYDPNTPAMASGEDFIEHFLEEGRGFCVHFATAGTMLLRMQGVPARYVTGYVATLDRQGRGTVRDSDAHAWVEIYLDGYGWYPVDMTPGYAGGASGVGLEGASGTQESTAPDTPDLPENPEEGLPDEEALPDQMSPDRESPDASTPETDGLPGEEEPEETGIRTIWKVLFGVALFWAALCAAYLLAALRRRQARAGRDANRSVLNAYRRYRRLRRWGCGEDNELERLAKKAKFSQHTLTAEERETAWKCLDENLRQSRVGQPLRRRWILAVLTPIF